MIQKVKANQLSEHHDGKDSVIDFSRVLFAMQSERDQTKTTVHLGNGVWCILEMPLDEVHKKMEEAESRFYNPSSSTPEDVKTSETHDVNGLKFRIDIHSYTDLKENKKHYLVFHSNFIMNDALKSTIGMVPGVDDISSFIKKYNTSIYIGELFEPEDVKKMIEESVKNFLS